MPVSYSDGLAKEYSAVRNKAGIFDVSHMGQLSIKGPEAKFFFKLCNGK